ncbi:MAG: hypothetical protein KatS3mg019_1266 [Fimbriimonadales bacterium]|nr:MAG: hypothetical protein KatS3mg019_1266 [Fimbriimonadales bacterium]
MKTILLLCALCWTLGEAQERPIQWLQRAQQAEASLNVAGVRLTELRIGRNTQRIEERFWRQGSRAERIEILAPADRRGEVLLLRDGRWLAYRPNAKEAFELPRMPLHGVQLLKMAVDLIQAGIVQAEMLPETALIGRPCVVMRLSRARPDFRRASPTDKSAPFPASVTLWVDQQTGLILRREVAMRPNEPALRMEITRLELNPRFPPDLFTLPQEVVARPLGGEYKTVEDAQRAVSFPIRTPSYLPAGATLKRILVHRRPPENAPIVILHYQTPHARFSIFQGYKTRGAGFQRPKRHRWLNTRFWQDGDYSLGIVGNLPQAEIERIANSLNRAGQ